MGPLGKALRKLRSQLAAAAQVELDAWQQDEEGCDEELGCGGICDRIAQAMGDVIAGALEGVTILDGGQDGDDHAYLLVYAQEGVYNDPQAYIVDIPSRLYEIGSGYSWRKREGVTLEADDVDVEAFGPFEDYGRGVEDVRENPSAGVLPTPFLIRARGDEAGDVENINSMYRSGHAYRGMEDDEFRATVAAGKGVRSRGDYSHGSEGTSFADHPADAESYVNYGRSDPRRTGRPNYIVEVKQGKYLQRDKRDGYLKTAVGGEVPRESITRIWRMDPRGDAVSATLIYWSQKGVRENPAPHGDCFAVAVQLAKKYGGEVIHGKVLHNRKRIWHAWVEYGTPAQRVMVRDEGQPEGVALSRYYHELKPRVAARYTVEEAQCMALRTGHWGPWTK